jgi:hypothetical protein
MMEERRYDMTIMMYLGIMKTTLKAAIKGTFMLTKHAVIKPLREEEETATNGVALEYRAQLLSVK